MPANLTRTLLEPIARCRRRSRWHAGLALVWLTAAAVGGGIILLYRGTGWAPPSAGWLLLTLAGLGVIAVAVRSRRRGIDARLIAREIEQQHPELNVLLQSAVEQEPDPATGELNFLQRRVVDRAAAVLRQQGWVRQALQRLVLWRFANQAAALLLLAALIGLVRVAPARTFALPHQLPAVRALEVLPGDTELEKGSVLVVMAKFPGQGPANATLVTLPARDEPRRIAMQRNLADPTFGAQVPNVTADLVYRVEHPDGASRDFKVTVFEYPRLVRADATLTFPAYTGMAAKTIEDTRRINSVEGTALEYQLTLNKPVAAARLWSTNGTELPLTPGASSNVLQLATTLTESGRYFLSLVDAAGRSNRVPEEISFVVVPNKEPQLKLASPRGDQRFSPLEEVRFRTEVSDDFGLLRHGLAYSVNGGETTRVELGGAAARFEKQTAEHLLMLETLGVATDDLVAFYLWAEDVGPDGQPRLVEGDIFFGDIRPLDEIYRPGQQGQSEGEQQQQQQQGNSPSSDLLELQKDIIAATWNVKRAEGGEKPSRGYKANVETIHESQEEALAKAEEVGGELRDARMRLHLQQAVEGMRKASAELARASGDGTLQPLPAALTAEQQAYQQLLRLQAREFQVTRSQRGGGGGGQRNQQQLDELDLAEQENRYETERQAQSQQTPEQREDLQVLSRLKDLARRQNDLNDRVKELQTALLAAQTEEEKEELRRELKRLQEQQQQLLSELDELNQRMSNEQNQSRMAEARQQLEQTRENMRNAAEQLGQEQASSALASGTRAQQDLENVRDDFRERTSNQFSEQMRELRDEARELARQETELQRQFEAINNDTRKSLGESPLRAGLESGLTQQRERLTNVLQNVRRVSEEAEIAEPLLSRQLYDTYRDVQRSQDTRNGLSPQLRQIFDSLRNESATDLENTYDISRELVEKGFAPWGQEVEKLAQQRVERLSNDIQKAAESILGDDLQALRTAERELERLANELSQDLAANGSRGQQPGEGTSQTQSTSGAGNEPSQTGTAGNQPGERQLAQAPGQRGQQPGQGQEGQAPGAGAGQSRPQSQPGQNQASGQSPGQQPGQGQGQGQQASATEGGGQGQGGRQPGGQRGQAGQPGPGQGGGQGGRQGGDNQGGPQYSLARGGGGGGADSGGGTGGDVAPGVFTAEGYGQWADRLRNIEEMLDEPDLRQQVSSIRDRARDVRLDTRRNNKPPQWDLVRSDILRPMEALRDQVREELARRQSPDNLVAIDRDPVPGRYSELVRRYYERLGSD